ncbi:hypothetical protein TVAG_025440 [Trichomonas vaginalis G3]|uniref:E2F/DP family winged-helix DNA-binding domain-containing protein n=1 Tax=Trichomonas vaginalis (strain ATCC PRA-98 / G3) TaxID=412133 RepID=A2G874_TRIV3|nr:transcription factor, enhancer of yellow 2 family [Trichomonas vaginalis G3]EAX86640.1 hypothetical protein TVAG_025440 [Trichomonas vaginalis G3]KAI5526136.1 transcription factor, enhancer of yellow 2 family [Trichomonas vaginalis G3]|eukprot:XP_001299570.1 hypothetical protein [Trichomonas vaginalis G3]
MALVATPHPLLVHDIEKDTVHISDDFKTSIQSLIDTLEIRSKQIYSIQSLSSKFHFHKRRLYDVLNVYESIGICKKLSVDSLLWLGFSNIHPTVNSIAIQNHVFDSDFNMDDLALSDPCITIALLTQRFLLLFTTLNSHSLDIKQCAKYLSMKNDKYKTTLCKLYQITYILESSNIISKSQKPGEVVLSKQYFVEEATEEPSPIDIFSVQSLLNNHETPKTLYTDRRKHFEEETMTERQKYFSFLSNASFLQQLVA